MDSKNKSIAPALLLNWDTAFFSKRIGKLLTHNLVENEAIEVDEWASKNKIDCLYYLAEGIDPNSSIAAENHGYHQVDLRVTFHINLEQLIMGEQANNPIRPAKESDLPRLKEMTRHNHQISRFFADEHFDREKCKQLYEVWIERDFITDDHLLWVWEENDVPVAYTSVHLKPDGQNAEIGLVGVHPDFRGRGMGQGLQTWVLTHLKGLGVTTVEVATQGRNINAQNLYQKCGYRLKSINLWYHKWF